MTEFTAHFRLPVPDFNQEPWHDQFRDLCVAIDDMAFEALLANASAWANSTAYAIGQIVLDETNGLLYVCAVAHTSPPFPTTFATFRSANPSYWNSIAQIPQQRGTWTTATTYIVGDFVIDNNRYAVCIVSHVSTTFNADLGAGKWSILIDLTTVNVGVNGLPETTIAAAPTVNLGAAAPSMLLISGTGQSITSFGTSANLMKIIRFDGVNTIVHNAATLILLNGENRVTAVGDVMFLRSDVSGNWRQLNYYSAATEAARGTLALATTTEANTGTNDTKAITPLKNSLSWNTLFNIYFPAGTEILMHQTTPPTGWTKGVTHNDKALRVVSGAVGSGGSSPFTTVFGKTGTDNFTLTAVEIPGHQHDAFIGDDGHTHTGSTTGIRNSDGAQASGGAAAVNLVGAITINSNTTGVRVRSTAGTAATANDKTASIGSGSAHAHGMDIRVQYVDTIIAVRN